VETNGKPHPILKMANISLMIGLEQGPRLPFVAAALV
jgi:hypothetical protein